MGEGQPAAGGGEPVIILGVGGVARTKDIAAIEVVSEAAPGAAGDRAVLVHEYDAIRNEARITVRDITPGGQADAKGIPLVAFMRICAEAGAEPAELLDALLPERAPALPPSQGRQSGGEGQGEQTQGEACQVPPGDVTKKRAAGDRRPLLPKEEEILDLCSRRAFKGCTIANKVGLSYEYTRRLLSRLKDEKRLTHSRNQGGYRTV